MYFNKNQVVVLEGAKLRRYQMVILKIAKDVAMFCNMNKINYSLSGGSILGSIRHNGFIPWDDDIDINMPRKDYDKFVKEFAKFYDNKYYIQTPDMFPELGLMVTQIRKKNTIARRKYDWKTNPCGVSIDIYIIENVFDNSTLQIMQSYSSNILSFIISSIRTFNNRNLPKELVELESRNIKYEKPKLLLGRIMSVIKLRKWIKATNWVNSLCKNSDSKYITIPTGRKHFNGEIQLRKDACTYRKGKFEDTFFNIPQNSESYLQHFYGEDYMSVPNDSEKEHHAFLELKF